MTVKFYQNKRNVCKYLEVHNDGHYHNSVKQFIIARLWKNGELMIETRNETGDGCLHRWRKENLNTLLEDYMEVKVV